MIRSILNCAEVDDADVMFVGINFERSSGLPGADKGPAEIIKTLDEQVEIYDPVTGTSPADFLKIAFSVLDGIDKISPDLMVGVVYRYCLSFLMSAFCNGKFPIFLGGDHSVSIGVFQALAEISKGTLPTLLQIDAHLDLRDNDEDFREPPLGRYSHCCTMRRAAEIGFPIVSLGIRSFSETELDFAARNNISFFPWIGRKKPSPREVIARIETKEVYLTLDIDGLDPSFAPATGVSVPGGLSWEYVLALLQELFRRHDVVAMDIVEVAPELGLTNLTAYSAAQLAYIAIALRFNKILRRERRKISGNKGFDRSAVRRNNKVGG